MRRRPLLFLLLATSLAVAAADSDPPPRDDHGDWPPDATNLAPDAPRAGQLELPFDADVFRLDVHETHRPLQFALRATAPGVGRLRFELLDATGARQHEACTVPSPGARRLFLFPRRKATYLLRVTGNEGARYVVSWGPARDDHGDDRRDATPLEVGRTAHGALETSADSDWFAVRLERGHAYRVAWSGVFEVQLHAPDGTTRRGELGTLEGVAPARDGVHWLEVVPSLFTGSYAVRVEELR